MSSNEPPPPTPPGGGPPPPPPPPPTPPPGTPGGYGEYGQPPGGGGASGGYGGYGQTPPAPGGYGAPAAQTGVPRPGELLDRFLARLIDGVLFAVVYAIMAIIFAAILISDPSVNFSTGEVDNGSRVAYNLVFSILSTVLLLAYYAVMESSRGATLGKMAMKLKVVGPDGSSHPTFVEALKRNVWLALGLLGILGTLGSVLSGLLQIGAIVLIVIGINTLPKRQTWFDVFAGDKQVLKVG